MLYFKRPCGIRPAFYYSNEEIVVVASERPAIQTAFNLKMGDVKAIEPGNALIVKKNGNIEFKARLEPRERKECSFERIYFSRGSDIEIYEERKQLGFQLTDAVLEYVNYDIKHTVFFIPNTAETAFYGLVKGIESKVKEHQIERF